MLYLTFFDLYLPQILFLVLTYKFTLMKKIAFIILVLGFSFSSLLSNAQTLTATLGRVVGKHKGDTVHIPLYVTGFKNIGAFGFYIHIDTNVLIKAPGYSSCITNVSAALYVDSNSFETNFYKAQTYQYYYKGEYWDSLAPTLEMAFTVSGTHGVNIPDGKLMDLIFVIKSGITSVCFDTLDCIVADWNTNTLNVNYFCGSVESINCCHAIYSVENDIAKYTFDFFDQSTAYNVTGWNWDFGDSLTSTDKNPVHKFKKDGLYKVCMQITSTDSGKALCTDKFCNYIDVEENITNDCNSFFNAFYIDSTANYSFIDESIGTNISAWSWDFGDASTGSATQNPFHKYKKSGDYSVCLTVSSYEGAKLTCSNSYCEDIFVQIDSAIEKCMASPYILQDSIPWKYDFYGYAAGDSIAWSWNFGDGNHAYIQNTAHTYTNPGEYIACLTINSYSGGVFECTDSYCQTIKVDSLTKLPPDYCINYFTYNITDTTKTNFNVNFTAYAESDNPLYYNWNFGDGTKTTVTTPVINHTFADKSSFNTCLKTYPVIDSTLCSFTSCENIFGFIDSTYSFGSISGEIYAGMNTADVGSVALIKLDSIYAGHIFYFNNVKISQYGYYSFSNIPYGNYYVFAMLNPSSKYYKNYLPSFFAKNWNWENANTVLAGNNQSSLNINIELVPLSSKKSQGNGCISGKIYDPDFKPGASQLQRC